MVPNRNDNVSSVMSYSVGEWYEANYTITPKNADACMVFSIVSFPDRLSSVCMYRFHGSILKAIRAGVGWVWDRD